MQNWNPNSEWRGLPSISFLKASSIPESLFLSMTSLDETEEAGRPLGVDRKSSRSHGNKEEGVDVSDWRMLRRRGGDLWGCCGNGERASPTEGLGASPNCSWCYNRQNTAKWVREYIHKQRFLLRGCFKKYMTYSGMLCFGFSLCSETTCRSF